MRALIRRWLGRPVLATAPAEPLPAMPPGLRFVLLLVALAALAACASLFVLHRQDERRARVVAQQMTGGDLEAGRALTLRYGCGSCHEIPGVSGAQGRVGPSLEGFAGRAYIAGLLSNQPDQLARWLRDPQSVSPGTGMPDQNIDERDARDLSAYLYTLR